jgi:phosphatidylglycerophosphatase A
MTPDAEASVNGRTRKPQTAFAIATVLGTGYLRPGPGTYGSLFGMLFSVLLTWLGARHLLSLHGATDGATNFWATNWISSYFDDFVVLLIAAVGVYASGRVASWAKTKDPQYVVVDEVSGQLVTYYGLLHSTLNWKTWLLGFLLFRFFDILKPFPIRYLEKLPGGWGIMADDWLAGIYAALLLRLALHFNLL